MASNPPVKPAKWLVFKRDGGLLGGAIAMRAYDAWEMVNPQESFGECKVVQLDDWRSRELKRLAADLAVAGERRDWELCNEIEGEIHQLTSNAEPTLNWRLL